MTTDTHIRLNWSIDPSVLRPVIRELLVILALGIGIQLGFLLPGTNQPLLETTITGDDIVLGIGTLGLVASLVDGAPKLDRLITECIRELPEINKHAGRIGYALVLLIAVLVAHAGFEPLVNPVVAIPWLYDLVFFLIALVPLASIVIRVRATLDPLSAALTTRFVSISTDSPASPDT